MVNFSKKNPNKRKEFRKFIFFSGDLVIDDLDHLNHTETQIIAIARDSGSPPRETSVPVVVRFVGKKLHPKPSLKIGTTNTIYWNSLGLFRDKINMYF